MIDLSFLQQAREILKGHRNIYRNAEAEMKAMQCQLSCVFAYIDGCVTDTVPSCPCFDLSHQFLFNQTEISEFQTHWIQRYINFDKKLL